ncbi:MAG: iron-sulfur cluster assembly protein [Emcibacter sp.]|nr:iron-sulfur cluster assembly protein [Emcibacter sp.]
MSDSEQQTEITTGAEPDYSLPLSEETRNFLRGRIEERMREIYDPEIPIDIYEMGLIYEINVAEDGKVEIVMTLTTPHCPVAETMPGDVQIRALDVDGVRDVNVELVWDPPWTIYMMSEAARLEMGFM